MIVSFSENLRLAWSCVKANKMRSMLTMLGIIIGISSVITISTIGSSLRQTISNSFSDLMSTNQYAVQWLTYDMEETAETPTFDMDQAYEFKETFKESGVAGVVVNFSLGSATYTNGDSKSNIYIEGISEAGCMMSNYDILMGRDIEFQDSFENRKVCVVSDLFVKYGLNGIDNPIGERIEIELESGEVMQLYIIGVYKMEEKQASLGQQKVKDKDKETSIFIPVEYAWDVAEISESERTNPYLLFLSSQGADGDVLKENTQKYFQSRKEEKNSYFVNIQSLEEQLGIISKVLNVVTVAVSVIAAISLLVGGIGVMNIMLVSVVERTKEIGIRKALGAKNKVIEAQFLVESVLICAIGGVIGILLGFASGGLIAFIVKQVLANSETLNILSVSVSPPLGAIIVSFLFSSFVGIVFGLYPARRAARLSPIDALRYE